MATYFCAYGVALVASILLTPLLARLARPLRLIDAPGPRKVHRTGIPNSGGTAVFLATIAAALLTVLMYDTATESATAPLGHLLCLLLPGAGIFVLGLVDDIRNVPARWKLAGQLAAAVAVCLCGIRLNLAAFWPDAPLPAAWLGWPVTVLWIVGVMNAINLIDGLDALAGGLSTIACLAVAFAGLSADQPVVVVVALAALGGLSGFLPYNLHPARVFLGDSGALFLGFVVATASVMVTTGRSAQPQWLLLPLLALALPLMEMIITILRRLLRRRPIFVADRGHVHHRLLDCGFSQRSVVLLLCGLALAATRAGMTVASLESPSCYLLCVAAMASLLIFFLYVYEPQVRSASADLRRILHVVGEARTQQRIFERARLRLDGIPAPDAWWHAVQATAEEFDFNAVAVSAADGRGGRQRRVWRSRTDRRQSSRAARFSSWVRMPENPDPVLLVLDVPVDDSLESAGRRVQLFGRLMDDLRCHRECAGAMGQLIRTRTAGPPRIVAAGADGEIELREPVLAPAVTVPAEP